MSWSEPKHKHRPCPCGCNELADECMNPRSGLNAAFQISQPDPTCVCCYRSWPKPDARVDRGPIHCHCWDEHHSSPYESHGCRADEETI